MSQTGALLRHSREHLAPELSEGRKAPTQGRPARTLLRQGGNFSSCKPEGSPGEGGINHCLKDALAQEQNSLLGHQQDTRFPCFVWAKQTQVG